MRKSILQLTALALSLGLTGMVGCSSQSGGGGCGGNNNNNTSSGPCNPAPNCGQGTHQSGCVCVAGSQ